MAMRLLLSRLYHCSKSHTTLFKATVYVYFIYISNFGQMPIDLFVFSLLLVCVNRHLTGVSIYPLHYFS